MNNQNPQDHFSDQELDKKLKRDLILIALAGLLIPCGLCWTSMRSNSFETTLIPLLHGFLVGGYTLFAFYQREQEKDLALPLWRELLTFVVLAGISALFLAWLIRSVGWSGFTGTLILAMGLWGLFLIGRRIWLSRSFSRQSVLYEIDSIKLDMVSIKGSHPIYAQLVYRYAGDYRGELQNDRVQRRMAEIRTAIDEGRFRAIVRYLPDEPRVHRLESWWIEKNTT
jgi:hypothetical protein